MSTGVTLHRARIAILAAPRLKIIVPFAGPSGKIINHAPERKPDYMPSDNRTPLTASNDNVEHGKYDNPANADRNRRGAIAPADVWPYHRYVESRTPLLESSQTRHTRSCMPVARQARAAEAGTLRAGAHASKTTTNWCARS